MDSVSYYGNENLMMHVWDNLISNAVKFSPCDDTITIRLKTKANKIIFEIEDNGIGVPEELQKHIFDKFYQADSSHKQEGNGLGLALVKKILSLEDGDISVSNKEDKGCRFTVVLKDKK